MILFVNNRNKEQDVEKACKKCLSRPKTMTDNTLCVLEATKKIKWELPTAWKAVGEAFKNWRKSVTTALFLHLASFVAAMSEIVTRELHFLHFCWFRWVWEKAPKDIIDYPMADNKYVLLGLYSLWACGPLKSSPMESSFSTILHWAESISFKQHSFPLLQTLSESYFRYNCIVDNSSIDLWFYWYNVLTAVNEIAYSRKRQYIMITMTMVSMDGRLKFLTLILIWRYPRLLLGIYWEDEKEGSKYQPGWHQDLRTLRSKPWNADRSNQHHQYHTLLEHCASIAVALPRLRFVYPTRLQGWGQWSCHKPCHCGPQIPARFNFVISFFSTMHNLISYPRVAHYL